MTPAENITAVYCSPDSFRNMMQFSILHVRVQVNFRDLARVEPFRVMIRTNLNQAHRIRRQVIDLVEKGQSYSTDYYDLEATYDAARNEYGVDILLSEVGFFEFKARVESASPQKPWVRWADGANVGISVTPLEYGRNNSIYCAWIRQYVPNKNLPSLRNPEMEETIRNLEEQGSFVLPPGGNFDQFIQVLPFVINELGMKIIHLLPINPVPIAYGRMGMTGSPYATTDYFGIDHTHATFSRYKTIEDQLIDVTSTVHGLGGKVMLDMVINHTGWASSILFTHRKWIKVGDDRRIISPGAWGVVWGDLVELDYKHKDLWQYMAGVFLTWCRRGVDAFRLDAGYMVPQQVWEYIISKVREEFPNTMFLLEGLGGPWETTERLLTQGQMNWAYSELFQNYTRQQITDYLKYAQRVSAGKGVMVHYAETHDNDRLAKKGKIFARMRLFLSSLTSFSGAWGFTNGVEWLATEKIDVHRNAGLNWGSPDNLVSEISQINRILSENPAFWECNNLEFVDIGDNDVLAFIRRTADRDNVIAGLINLNTEKPRQVSWDWSGHEIGQSLREGSVLHELLAGSRLEAPAGKRLDTQIEPGGCLLYRFESLKEPYQPRVPALFGLDYNRIALTYQILLSRFNPAQVGKLDQERLLPQITDFRKFIVLVNSCSLERIRTSENYAAEMEQIGPELVEQHSAVWTFRESTKEYIVAGDKWLVVHIFVPCTAYLKTPRGTLVMESLPNWDGVGHVVFFPPQEENQTCMLTFNWKIQRGQMIQRQWQDEEYPILWIPTARRTPHVRQLFPLQLQKPELGRYATVLLTNGQGGICQTPAIPGAINTKYDTLLAIPPERTRPTDRIALVKMVKDTVQVGQKFFDLDQSFLTSLTRFPHPVWNFEYNDGEYVVKIEKTLVMPQGENTLYVRYRLREANTAVKLISKYYVEHRSPHDQVHIGYDEGRRQSWERTTNPLDYAPGFSFEPQPGLKVSLWARLGEYITQPHWVYDLYYPQDAERGLDAKGDTFSPGMFSFVLNRGKSQVITISTEAKPAHGSIARAEEAHTTRFKHNLAQLPNPSAQKDPLVRTLLTALDQFIIQSPIGYQLAAGYPWLGTMVRQALYCTGGLLAAGRADVAQDLILHSAGTEKDGLLAESLSGPPTYRNIESSLRLFLAARAYVEKTKADSFWDRLVGDQRSLREVLINIYESLKKGAWGFGIDESSGFLYCPAGTTWMSTTEPMATPRQGYPIEIQAMWRHVLQIVETIFPPYAQEARSLRERLEEKFMPLFWRDQRGWLADVLLTDEKLPAGRALADSSLRFNQLHAIQLKLIPKEPARQVIDVVTRRLLIAGGVRSLSEDPLAVPLRIVDSHGVLLADPRMPYKGQCTGDEIARRVAYHNGTAWTSIYPIFIEARARVDDFSHRAIRQALAFCEPLGRELTQAAIGSICEMKDGNYPHAPRGCHSYAVAVAELLRVYVRFRYEFNQRSAADAAAEEDPTQSQVKR